MGDLIDRQALLRQIDIDSEGEPGYYGDTWKFIDTIKKMPSALSTNLAEVGTDCISRQAVLALPIYNEKNLYGNIIREYVDIEDVKQLPTIQPKRGRWVGKYPVTSVCSECGYLINDSKVKVFAFCPNCGAEMEVDDE